MSRPLRIEYPGAWYHVMNRGLSRQIIFHRKKSIEIFYALLQEVHDRYKIQIHAFCLMDNHYHLLIHTPLANLGQAMKHIDSIYTIRNNRLVGRDGPLFRGRYKAILVDKDNYLLQLSRYIHLNPFFANMIKKPEKYPWSSYKYFLKEEAPSWLYRDATLAYFNSNKIEEYRNFIDKGMKCELSFAIQELPILGSNDFIAKINKENIVQENKNNMPHYNNLIKRFYPTFDEIIMAVAKYYNKDSVDIINSDLKGDISRKMAIYLCYHLTGKSYKQLAEEFKKKSVYSLEKLCQRFEFLIKKNGKLLEIINVIKDQLSNVQT